MFELYDIALVPLITSIVQVIKLTGLKNKYCPLIAVIIGILFGVFYLTVDIREGVLVGIILGLSASGLYSGSKNMFENGKANEETTKKS